VGALRVAFHTLGCKVNQYETEVMAKAFTMAGDCVVPFEEEADLYIVNTCTVTAVSDKKSRQALRAAKRRNPNATVAAVGCYAQVAEEELQSIPEVDFVVGVSGKTRIPELARAFIAGNRLPALTNADQLHDFEPMEATRSERTRATLKIQDGCDNHCSYCAIPHARGRSRSKPIKDVLHDVNQLVDDRVLEIVLTGIEIASYECRAPSGAPSPHCTGIIGEGLVELLNALSGIAPRSPLLRIRLGSLEPRVITPAFAQTYAAMPFLSRHLHLSLQSGSDSVLKRMGRHYSVERFVESVAMIREYVPSIMLTTDVIVGFPGEEEKEFEQTLQTVAELRFLKVHVFQYSKRPGTIASHMSGQIPADVKAKRARLLTERCNSIRAELLAEQVGTEQEVLLETHRNGVYSGYSSSYFPVKAEGEDGLCGMLAVVTIERSYNDALHGRIVQVLS